MNQEKYAAVQQFLLRRGATPAWEGERDRAVDAEVWWTPGLGASRRALVLLYVYDESGDVARMDGIWLPALVAATAEELR